MNEDKLLFVSVFILLNNKMLAIYDTQVVA